MRRTSMKRLVTGALLTGLAFLTLAAAPLLAQSSAQSSEKSSPPASSQSSSQSSAQSSTPSLGDTAREHKREHRAVVRRRVITNDEISHRDAGARDKDRNTTEHHEDADEPKDAKQWRVRIQKQRVEVSKLQAHLERMEQIDSDRKQLRAEPRLTAETCASTPERCEGKRQLAIDLARSRERLKIEQAKLEELQDAARKKDLPASVWDPE